MAADSRTLMRRAAVVASGTLVSRVLGQVRESVIAAAFPKEATDAFFVAFTIPNALRGLLAEGAMSAALVPIYSEARAKHGDAAARDVYARLAGAMLLVLALVSALGVVAAPLLVGLYASGYADDPERWRDTVALTRWVFPYIFFMGSGALGAAVLNVHGRFAVPALAPALLNVAQIAAPLVFVVPAALVGLPPVGALAIGALVGGLLQAVVLLPPLVRANLLAAPKLDLAHPEVRRAFTLLLPLTLGLGIYQVNVMLSRQLASYLPEGSQSYLNYGQRLVEIPQGMFAVAIASAALPMLADLRARGETEQLLATFRDSLRTTLFIAVPATLVLALLAEPIVTVLFARGHFGHVETLETARSLSLQALGVWAVAAVRVVVPMFHVEGDTRTPVWASGANLAVFLGLALALIGSMTHAGIALASSAASVVQVLLLLLLLRRKLGPLGLRAVATSAARTLLLGCVAALAGSMVCRLGHWERGGNDLVNVGVLAASLAASVAIYLGAAYVLRAPELGELRSAVSRRRAR